MRLVLNERKILYETLKNGFIDEKRPLNTVNILAKYYFSIGISKTQVLKNIFDFFEKNYIGHHGYYSTIEKMIDKIHRNKIYTLTNIEFIGITKNELQTIRYLRHEKFEKLAFVFLVYAKIYNEISVIGNDWVNEEHKYIFKDAKLHASIIQQGKMIFKLAEMGYFYTTKIVDKVNIKVNFLDHDNNNNYIIKITDFRNYVFEYLKWRGTKINSCKICDILYHPSNHSQIYCKACEHEKQLEWQRESMRKLRANRVISGGEVTQSS